MAIVFFLFLRSIHFFRDRVSLSHSGWSGTHCVEQSVLELTEIHLLLPLSAEIKGI